MKIPGTKLDIPVPEGWRVDVDLDNRKVFISGPGVDTYWYRDRQVTVEIPLSKTLQLYHWDGTTRCRARWKEIRKRVPQRWVGGQGWVPTGQPPKRSTSNVRKRVDTTLFDLANGDI